MFSFGRFVLSLLPLSDWTGALNRDAYLLSDTVSSQQNVLATHTKSIAIVGAGSGGLAVLRTILDLPEDVREGWEVVLFERRRDVGGVWLPDPPGYKLDPHHLPETPLYPDLHTNTPHPTMTYPHFTFPPNTSLFPAHTAVQQYLAHYAEHFNLTSHIRLNHTVVSADWNGDEAEGQWEVQVQIHGDAESRPYTRKHTFDHLIVANGHYHYPYIPQWNGTDEWLANTPSGTPKREITHSIYYRDPERYKTRRVVIVGAGASARDVVLHVGPVARKAYLSRHADNRVPYPFPNIDTVIPKPAISHFTKNAVVFIDSTSESDVDSVVLGTGYENRVPFLSPPRSSALLEDASTSVNSTTTHALTTNLRYIFPLFKTIFSLSPVLPPTALSFIGLPTGIANCPSDHAQGLLVAHALANASLLPPRAEMLSELVAHENKLRALGFDPYNVGHRLVAAETEQWDYQDDLVQYLQDHGVPVNDGKKYVEPWRRRKRDDLVLLKRAWERVEQQGDEARWLYGVETEEEWVDLIDRLQKWERQQEEEHGEIWPQASWDALSDPFA